jgi:hypothetical protein
MSIKQPICAFVALGNQHAMRLRHNTVGSESRCSLKLRYVDLVVSIEVPLKCAVFHCVQLLNSGLSAKTVKRVIV